MNKNSSSQGKVSLYVFLLISFLFTSCYSVKWADEDKKANRPAPVAIQQIFGGDFKLTMDCLSPGAQYKYDISEKDIFYDSPTKELVFTKVEMYLNRVMPTNQILVDILFKDAIGHQLELKKIDLMRIIPKLDMDGEMAYPEYLLEEFSRYGIVFRKEHKEFFIGLNGRAGQLTKDATARAHRVNLVNNCLDPTKWELELRSADYSDFDKRLKSSTNFNQNKILSHAWFYLNKALYRALLIAKNGDRGDLFDLPYDELSVKSEKVVMDLSKLRKKANHWLLTKTLEIGHQTNRKIEPIDLETYYKWQFGLIGEDTILTYKSVCEQPMKLAKFDKEGFYDYEENPRVYDFSFIKTLDKVTLKTIKTSGSNCNVEITINGSTAPYKFIIGNIDLALLEEQKMLGIGMGINPYPKSRRYNPQQATIVYDPDYYPEGKKPYCLMLDTNEDKWVNNQYKGVEKVFLSYDSLDENILEIYLLSYERELPVWMARVKLSPFMREMIRARRNLYNY